MLAKNKVRHPSLPLLWLRNIGAITQNISVTYFPRFNVFYSYFCDNRGNRTSCVSFVGTNVVGSVVFQLIQIVCHRIVNDQNSRRIFIFVTRHRRCEWPKNWNPFLQQTLIKIQSLTDLQTSLVLHLMSLTLTWPLVDYTSPVMSAISIRYRTNCNQ